MYMIIEKEPNFYRLAASETYFKYGEVMATVTNGNYVYQMIRIGNNVRTNGYYHLSKHEWIDYAVEYDTFEEALNDIDYVKEKLDNILKEMKEPSEPKDFEM